MTSDKSLTNAMVKPFSLITLQIRTRGRKAQNGLSPPLSP